MLGSAQVPVPEGIMGTYLLNHPERRGELFDLRRKTP
jgi:hypothetical protein